MQLATLDLAIILLYILATLVVGFWISSRASKDIKSYFLGGNKLAWWQLGLSNASGMFDISGTMWLVYLLFVYGLTSVYIPWLWPVFNQIFLMVYLSAWLRRSGRDAGTASDDSTLAQALSENNAIAVTFLTQRSQQADGVAVDDHAQPAAAGLEVMALQVAAELAEESR